VPLLLLLGDSTVEIETELRAVRARFHPADVVTIDVGEGPLSAVAEAAATAGLFDPERLVIVHGLQLKLKGLKAEAPEADDYRRLLSAIAPTTTLLLLAPGIKEDHVLNAIVRSVGGQVKAFNLPRPRELPGWIVQRARQREINVEPSAASLLADLIGPDTVMLDSELEKLGTFAGQDGPITAEMVGELTGQVTQATIFALIDAIVDGRRAQAYGLLQDQLDRKSDGPIPAALGIIRMIARQLRILLRINVALAARTPKSRIIADLKLPSYYADRYFKQASRFSIDRLRLAFEDLAQLEFDLLSGKKDPGTGLDVFVAELSRA